MTEAFEYLGRRYEVRQPDEDDAVWEWREVGHGWRQTASYRNAILMCGGHARLVAESEEVARAI